VRSWMKTLSLVGTDYPSLSGVEETDGGPDD
jgi:hypothetical protein